MFYFEQLLLYNFNDQIHFEIKIKYVIIYFIKF